MRLRSQSAACASIFVVAGLLGTAEPAVAAEPAIEEIVVTGSRIARRDFASMSPIATLDRLELTLAGTISVEQTLNTMLSKPTDKRLYAVQTAFECGYTVDQVHNLSKIDRWFLSKLKKISNLKRECIDRGVSPKGVDSLTKANFVTLKQAGFADKQLATYFNTTESIVRRRRLQFQVGSVRCSSMPRARARTHDALNIPHTQ